MVDYIVSSGNITSGTIVTGPDTLTVLSGATLVSATVTSNAVNGSNGVIYTSSGGVVSNTIVNAGALYVYKGASAFNTKVNSQGVIQVQSGGSSFNTVLAEPKAKENVLWNGVATSTLVGNGGSQMLMSGGITHDTTILSGGEQWVEQYGNASNTIINGGKQYVTMSGTALNTVINSGGSQTVYDTSAIVSNTIINNGGTQFINDEGISVKTTVYTGGSLYVMAGGVASSTIISGGTQWISSGGTSVDAVVYSGGLLNIASGGVISGLTTLEQGGSATIYPDAGGAIDLVGDTNGGLTISGLTSGGTVTTVVTVISGFSGTEAGNSDIITLAGITKDNVTSVEYKDASGAANGDYVTLTLKDSNKITLNIIGAQTAGYSLTSAPDGSLVYEVCFLTGTLIKTLNGEKAVETLRIGDEVMTFDWMQNKEVVRPIRWVGNKTVKVKSGLSDDEAGYPVRVLKDAIAEGVPYKDLLITPEHCLFFEDKFVPVRMLVNGKSIYYDRSITDYTYYHIETEEHSVIWADGMLTESYLDTGNRAQFKQAGSVAVLSFPREKKQWDKDACAILTVNRHEVEPIYRLLQQRAMNMGLTSIIDEKTLTNDPDLHLITPNGSIIKPMTMSDGIYSFFLHKGVNNIYISSRISRPSDVIGPFIDDRRSLGGLIGEMYLLSSNQIDIITNHLEETDLEGWDVVEQTPCRWTNGKALVKIEQNYPKERILMIKVLAAGPYLLNQENDKIEIKKIA